MDDPDDDGYVFDQGDCERYEYSEIGHGAFEYDFRLLKLLPGSGADVKCELFDAFLDKELIEYEAISYVWGPRPSNRARIFIDQKVLPVWPSLYDVLDHLRDVTQPRILWIDGICINQACQDDRSRQVQQMAKIFGNARKVHVWLGRPPGDTPLIMSFSIRYRERNA